MPIAAVPDYLGQDFKETSPGLRFGMYLTLWGVNRRGGARLWTTHDIDYQVRGQDREEREVKEENKVSALAHATRLTPADRKAQRELASRQAAATATVPEPAVLRLDGRAVAPFTTGLGNEHPLENGFAFLSPYGLPYLPGSGVKGVLRQAARELASGSWGDPRGWGVDRRYALQVDREATIELSAIDVLFGLESADGGTDHARGALTFWDVIPQIEGDSLLVEIMTPHQAHYYQAKPRPDRNDQRAHNKWMRDTAGSLSPHDSGQPNPISFLTVPPGSGFTFIVTCDTRHLERLAPELGATDKDGQPRWKALMHAAFAHAFEWLGFGAKTAVGYGAMQRDDAAEQRRAEEEEARARAEEEARQRAAEEARRATLSERMRAVEAFVDAMRQRSMALRGGKERLNENAHRAARDLARDARAPEWTPEEKRAAADAIETWLPRVVEGIDVKQARRDLGLRTLRGES